MKKPKVEKRDWNKYPTLYTLKTDVDMLCMSLISVKIVLEDEKMSDLEKMQQINAMTFGYDKDNVESIHQIHQDQMRDK